MNGLRGDCSGELRHDAPEGRKGGVLRRVRTTLCDVTVHRPRLSTPYSLQGSSGPCTVAPQANGESDSVCPAKRRGSFLSLYHGEMVRGGMFCGRLLGLGGRQDRATQPSEECAASIARGPSARIPRTDPKTRDCVRTAFINRARASRPQLLGHARRLHCPGRARHRAPRAAGQKRPRADPRSGIDPRAIRLPPLSKRIGPGSV